MLSPDLQAWVDRTLHELPREYWREAIRGELEDERLRLWLTGPRSCITLTGVADVPAS